MCAKRSNETDCGQIGELLRKSSLHAEEFSVNGELSADGVPTLAIRGKVLGAEAATLVDRVCEPFADVPGDLIIDLAQCTFFSSVAIGFVVALAHQRQKHGGRLIILKASLQIKKSIYVMGMGDYFTFIESLDELCGGG